VHFQTGFNPNPTGNIWINGTMIIKAGMLQMRFRILLDRLSYNKTPKINRAKKTGIQKSCSLQTKAIAPLISIHKTLVLHSDVTFFAENRL
jgi:hypothetical protein